MKLNKVDLFMLLCNDKIIFRDIEGRQCEMTISGINRVPDAPVYDYLFESGAEINFSGELEIKQHFRRIAVYCLIPDDINAIEKKAVEEYCVMKLQAKDVTLINQCDLLDTENYSGIAVSKTGKSIAVVCSIRLKKIKNIVYIDKNSDTEAVKKAISEAIGENRFEDMDVCLNNCNEDMNEFRELGKLVDSKTILENAKKVIESLKYTRTRR